MASSRAAFLEMGRDGVLRCTLLNLYVCVCVCVCVCV